MCFVGLADGFDASSHLIQLRYISFLIVGVCIEQRNLHVYILTPTAEDLSIK